MNCKKVIGFDTPANLTSSVYRVKPASLLPVNDNENAKCVDESSLHLCTVTSSHGIVKIGYTDEMKVFGRASATTATECTVS